jgi:riboflavin kinase/FMN adenylyltransferase
MPARSVIAIGNFDGVHVGHQGLLRTARQIATEAGGGAEVIAVTFDRHPLAVLRPHEAPPTILHAEQREAALDAAGADRVEWLTADPQLFKLEPRRFVEMLCERHDPLAIVEGPNFRFGRNRSGDPATLERLGSEMGFAVRVVSMTTVTLRDKTQVNVSSSLVRWLIGVGRMADATLCLGRPFELRGKVVEGEKRGRRLGFPTANLDHHPQMLPAPGVYGATCVVDGVAWPVALSIGVKPTFGEHAMTCEAHLIGFEGDLYGRTLSVSVRRWLRDQHAFTSATVLRNQLEHDVRQARKLYDAHLLDAAELAVE